MIHASRIASGLADHILKIASPDTNPKAPIENAFRRGVRLGLSTRPTSRGCPTRALLYEQPEGVCVAVRDTGPGLRPESLPRLFEPFYTTKPDGMGMGLSICRSIIEAHGGRLWATRCEPRGALFQFTIPAD